MNHDAVLAAAAVVAERTGRPRHLVGVVLGSGLSGYAATLPGAVALPYAEIPGFPMPRVEGHSGTLFSVEMGGHPILILAGRVHAYEGWRPYEVSFAARMCAFMGIKVLILTNSAGGALKGMAPGSIMMIRDHLRMSNLDPQHDVGDDWRFGIRGQSGARCYR